MSLDTVRARGCVLQRLRYRPVMGLQVVTDATSPSKAATVDTTVKTLLKRAMIAEEKCEDRSISEL
jgi:hypothetical protein